MCQSEYGCLTTASRLSCLLLPNFGYSVKIRSCWYKLRFVEKNTATWPEILVLLKFVDAFHAVWNPMAEIVACSINTSRT